MRLCKTTLQSHCPKNVCEQAGLAPTPTLNGRLQSKVMSLHIINRNWEWQHQCHAVEQTAVRMAPVDRVTRGRQEQSRSIEQKLNSVWSTAFTELVMHLTGVSHIIRHIVVQMPSRLRRELSVLVNYPPPFIRKMFGKL